MRILALDATLTRVSAAVLAEAKLVAASEECGGRGQPSLLPGLVRRVLQEAGIPPAALTAVAVGVGPGSFTGLRAAAALAQGIALGVGCPVHGVAARDALALRLAADLRGVGLWFALSGAGGKILLARPEAEPTAVEEAALPQPQGPVAVAGDAAANIVVARLAARGAQVRLLGRVPVEAADVARAAAAALAGEGPGVLRAAVPLYAEPPAVRLPA